MNAPVRSRSSRRARTIRRWAVPRTTVLLATAVCAFSGFSSGAFAADPSKGQSMPPPMQAPCTLIGCFNRAEIVATFHPSAAIPGRHDFEFQIDGQTVRCAGNVVDATQQVAALCSGDVQVLLWFGPVRFLSLSDQAASADVPASQDDWRWVLQVLAQPSEVHVTHRVGDRTLVARTAAFPVYGTFYPNGARCDAGCKVARVAWRLP